MFKSNNARYIKSNLFYSNKQRGFLRLPNDNIVKTLAVAISLCLVCSVIVSSSAVLLKPAQVANKLLDKKKNIISVAGISGKGSIEELFKQVESRIIDIKTGEYSEDVDANLFDQRIAVSDPAYRVDLSKGDDIAQIRAISKYANVYLVKKDDVIDKYILPISGYGLWSTLYGFIALESDAHTVFGITFYEHTETPGLGGEIENPKWQAGWNGKELFDAQGNIALKVIKGAVSQSTPKPQHSIDGLSGATLTSDGVSNIIEFWMGANGFGPYLDRIQSSTSVNNNDSTIQLIPSIPLIDETPTTETEMSSSRANDNNSQNNQYENSNQEFNTQESDSLTRG